jgi:hypothetical protein
MMAIVASSRVKRLPLFAVSAVVAMHFLPGLKAQRVRAWSENGS